MPYLNGKIGKVCTRDDVFSVLVEVRLPVVVDGLVGVTHFGDEVVLDLLLDVELGGEEAVEDASLFLRQFLVRPSVKLSKQKVNHRPVVVHPKLLQKRLTHLCNKR